MLINNKWQLKAAMTDLKERLLAAQSEKDMEIIAVLSTTVLPLDGTYKVQTVGTVDISGTPHYIGHPGTAAIVERLGAVKAHGNLFGGLEVGQSAACFAIKQGRSTRAAQGFTSPHQDVGLDDISIRVITRIE